MGRHDGSSGTSSRNRLYAILAAIICAAAIAGFAIGGYAIAGEGGEEAATADSYFSGSGTESDPYILDDATDLVNLSTLVNAGTEGYVDAYYQLANDIDMSSVSNFTTIGNSSSNTFQGTIDGNGYRIDNLTIDSTTIGTGFIGYAYNVTVKDLVISGEYTSTKVYMGGIIALGVGGGTITITNCGSEVDITCTSTSANYVGGILGRGYSSSAATVTIDSCYNTGDITVTGSTSSASSYVAGIVGQLYYLSGSTQSVTNCYNTGDITSTKGSGAAGIVGCVGNNASATDAYIYVANCYNTGTISANGNYSTRTGGVYAYVSNVTSATYAANYVVTNCYYLESTSSQVGAEVDTITVSSCSSMTSDEMMASSFVDTLNTTEDTVWIASETYPVLVWECDGSPTITTDLSTDMVEYAAGATEVAALEIAASLPVTGATGAGGALSYQWYSTSTGSTSDGVAIEGATSTSYTPSVSTAGHYYYYCVVTNTWTEEGATEASTASATSAVASVLVHSGTAAATPTITTQPVSVEGLYQGDEAVLTVAAEVSGDGAGELSYQWYEVTTSEVTDEEGNTTTVETATAIDGATEASYTADTSDLGTRTYYCVATNVFEETLTASATSSSATVTVVVTEISSAADLKALADRVDGGDTCSGVYFVLTADIDLQSDESTQTWDPIGTSSISFAGNLDGQGYTISGMVVDVDGYCGGLFASIGAGATIENLQIEGTVKASSWAGGLAGYILGTGVTISNVGCDVDVEATSQYAGGLLGTISNSGYAVVIEGCYSRGTVTVSGSVANSYAGGLIGYTYVKSMDMTDCYSTSDVTATGDCVGGLIGYATCSSSGYYYVTNCYAAGSVSGDDYTGTFAGYPASALVITNCYALEDEDLETNGAGTSTTGEATVSTASEMTASAFPAALGTTDEDGVTTTSYLVDSTGKNGGYPILEWEYVYGAPAISSQPDDVYTVRNADATMTVVAALPEETPEGVLTYQWYSNTTGSTSVSQSEAVEGATSATLSVPTGKDDTGITYYFCVVTNTYAEDGSTYTISSTSQAAQATVISAIEAAVPQVASVTGDVEYDYGADAEAIEVSVTMDSEGAGVLSYQWYVSETRDNDVDSATAIDGATEASYVPSTDTAGTLYYFCVVTNTFEDVKSASATSLPVKVTVANLVLADADDVVALSEAVAAGDTFEGVTVEVVADIDMSGVTDYTPIGTSSYPFAGTIAGNGHTISGLTVSAKSAGSGLFGYTSGATISDLAVEGTVTSTSGGYAGGIVGSATNTTFEGVSFSGTVDASASRAAGIAGYATGCTFEDVEVDGSIIGTQYIGSIAGYAITTTISYATNNASVTSDYTSGSSTYVGGIVGYFYTSSSIDHAANYGDVYSPGAYVGGITGYSRGQGNSITLSKNAGDVEAGYSGSANVGGIAGYLYYGTNSVPTKVIGCYNTGDVTASGSSGNRAGGLFGYVYNGSAVYTEIADCYSTGTVTTGTSTYYGWLAGYLYKTTSTYSAYTTVTNSYGLEATTVELEDGTTVSYGCDYRVYTTSSVSSGYTATDCATLTLEQMQGTEGIGKDSDGNDYYFLETINDNENGVVYVADTDGVNDGFPMLEWETEASGDDTVYAALEVTVASGATVTFTNTETGTSYDAYAESEDGTRVYTLPAGTYTYAAECLGYFDAEGEVELTEDGATLTIELMGLPEFEVSFSVTTEDGTAFSGTVALYDAAGDAVELDESYAATVPAGYYTYTVEMDGYVTQAGTIRVLDDDEALAIELQLDVEPVELTDDMVSVDSAVETGEALVPTVAVTATSTDDEGNETSTVLTEGYDYTVSYTDAEGVEIDASQIVSAGTYYVVVTGQYYYTGTATAAYVVSPSVAFAEAEAAELVYAGEALVPSVTVAYGDTVLTEGEDYTVAYVDADGATVESIEADGTYYAVISGAGSYGGTLTVEFYVKADLSLAAVDDVTAAYAGEAIAPAVTVTYGDAVLSEGTDYTVAYVDADGVESDSITAAGTYTAVVTGTGAYSGTATATVTVTADLSLATVTAEDSVYADGSEVGTTVTVTLGGTVLEAGVDYEAVYSDNVEIGTATVTVTGLGAYSGTATATFEVLAQYTSADLVALATEGTSALAAVEVSEDGTDVYVDATWATQEAVDALQAAVDAAKAAATSGDQQAMQDAGTAIEAALEEFAAATSAGTQEYVTGARWTRLGGTNRYGTNALAVSAAYGSSDVVVLASGQVAADALAASGLAGMLDAPVVLTKAAELTDDALETISDLGASTVYVMGGTSAVSDDVVEALEALGITVERVSGTNRVLTAIAIYETGAALGTWSDTAIVVNGFSTADALSASAYSYATESPIFMTNKDGSLSDETLAAISAGGFSQVYVVGGEGVVSAEALEALSAIDGVTAERIAGANRYATSAAMVELCLSEGMSLTHAVIACGSDESFADALSGGSLAGSTNSVIMLVKEAGSGSNSMVCVDDIVSANATSVVGGYILGGTGVFSSDFYEYVNSLD